MSLAKALQAAAGNAGAAGSALYVDDVFSTYLYTGNGSTQTITNGIQLGDGASTAGWISTINETTSTQIYGVKEASGAVYVVGGVNYSSNGYVTPVLLKYDLNGNLV